MTLGKWIVVIMLAAGIGAAFLVREVGMQQWELSKEFYRQHTTVLATIDGLQQDLRAGLSPEQALAKVAELEPQLRNAINGRTYFTLSREQDYLNAVTRWAKGEAKLDEVESAFGVLVGRIALESESLKDAPFQFATSPQPGTVPVITKKRRFI
jgi:C4-dicarboxylate-specific signal transduction histidine kinase